MDVKNVRPDPSLSVSSVSDHLDQRKVLHINQWLFMFLSPWRTGNTADMQIAAERVLSLIVNLFVAICLWSGHFLNLTPTSLPQESIVLPHSSDIKMGFFCRIYWIILIIFTNVFFGFTFQPAMSRPCYWRSLCWTSVRSALITAEPCVPPSVTHVEGCPVLPDNVNNTLHTDFHIFHSMWRGSFRFVQSLDSLISKQSQPHLQSGKILSPSPFVEDEEMAIKWVTAYLIFLAFYHFQSAAMWKIPRRFSAAVSLTLHCAFIFWMGS